MSRNTQCFFQAQSKLWRNISASLKQGVQMRRLHTYLFRKRFLLNTSFFKFFLKNRAGMYGEKWPDSIFCFHNVYCQLL